VDAPFRHHNRHYFRRWTVDVHNDNSISERARETADSPAKKKPYTPPSFRFEPVFEVSALACGKHFATQASCVHSRKAS